MKKTLGIVLGLVRGMRSKRSLLEEIRYLNIQNQEYRMAATWYRVRYSALQQPYSENPEVDSQDPASPGEQGVLFS